MVDVKGEITGVKTLASDLSGTVSTLKNKQKTYRNQKVGVAEKWATRARVENRLKKGRTVGDRVREEPAVAQTGRDVQQLAQRVTDLESAIGR
ncbi:MAG: hypothetical protein JF597_02755 [Streptomyces sp.]|jgi:hypothetical protein|uniref:hypothetical protein n=1 Tax=Streptomyces sp. TaxID=1931 RepID=UPI0025CD7D4F|nr:hypothetical protein [Streptomyces sp.]MBW8792536.1 hypothetical protein [Streptomyces sp.]